jgi:hypothetical protein
VTRRRIVSLALLGAVVFVAVSLLLARWLTTENRERDDVYALLRAQARGDAGAMLGHLDGCREDPACRAQTVANARRLRRPGTVKILAYHSDTAYALGDARGATRVAWTVVDRGLPVVQCVAVERTGNAVAGRDIVLRRLSAPIDREGSC